MVKLTWLGPDDYGEGERPPASLTWAGVTFPVGVAVEVSEAGHPVMVAKARGNRMFKVEDGDPYDEPAPAPIEASGAKSAEPDVEGEPSAFGPPPDYPPEENPKRKPGRPPKPKE